MAAIEMAEVEAVLPEQPRRRSRVRRWAGELGMIVLVAGLLGALALAFASPWGLVGATTSDLERYFPSRDGHAYLQRSTTPDGVTWDSGNTRRIPILRALNEWPSGARDALGAALGGDPDDLAVLAQFEDAAAIESRTRRIAADGTLTEETTYSVRTAEGDQLVALYNAAERSEIVLDPPMLSAPTDLPVGRTWTSEGSVGSGTYTFTGEVTEEGRYDGALGRFDECLRMTTALTISIEGQPDSVSETDQWACAQAGGIVEAVTTDDTGETTAVTVASDGLVAVDHPALPPVAAEAPAVTIADDWEVAGFGRLARTGDANESTFVPVYVEAETPLLVASSYNGDVVAFDATKPAEVVWRFRTGGTVYGTPAVDDQGRIFFGSTDKLVRAVDSRGVFLWSFATGDNVAARPLVVGDVVIVASEDRYVYALDAATGAERWRHEISGAVVSSPAADGDVVAVGGDAGGVVGLDVDTGERVWEAATDGAVEAPLAAADGEFVVLTNAGVVSAVDAATGEERWSSEYNFSMRSAPVVVDDNIVFIDDGAGFVESLSIADGSYAWTSAEDGFVGPAVVVEDGVVAVTASGVIHRLDPETGESLQRWEVDAADDPILEGVATGGVDYSTDLGLGLASGGGALWFADERATVYRLGAPLKNVAEPLVPAWIRTFSEKPYSGSLFATAAVWNDMFLFVDNEGQLLATDPATGEGQKLGDLPQSDSVATGPVVAGDMAVVGFSDSLVAVDVPTAAHQWTAQLPGTSLLRPTVAGDVVVAAAVGAGDDPGSAVTVVAYDLRSGDELWRAPAGQGVGAVGIAVDDTTVYAGGQAFDLASGEPRWTAELDGLPAGATAIDELGTYVPAIRPDDDSGLLYALDADGNERWRVEGELVASPTATPQIVGDVIVVANLDDSVAGYDRITGERLWRYEPGVARFGGDVLVTEGPTPSGEVWVPLSNARIDVLDAADGSQIRTFNQLDFELANFSKTQRPTALGDTVVVPIGLGIVGFSVE